MATHRGTDATAADADSATHVGAFAGFVGFRGLAWLVRFRVAAAVIAALGISVLTAPRTPVVGPAPPGAPGPAGIAVTRAGARTAAGRTTGIAAASRTAGTRT